MKTMLAVMCFSLVSIPMFAQTDRQPPDRQSLQQAAERLSAAFQRHQVRELLGNLSVTADHLFKEGDAVRAQGHVTITLSDAVIVADEAVIRGGEIQLQNARVTITRPPAR